MSSRTCDFCQECRAGLYCRADDAFLCLECDAKVHRANKLASRHERVWLCEVCEMAPAVVLCKADSASLCLRCDREVHSANPFAERHERHPVIPFLDTPISSSPSSNPFPATATATAPCPPAPVPAPALPLDPNTADDDTSAAEAASWILPAEAGAIHSNVNADPPSSTPAPSAVKTEIPAPLFYPPPETVSPEGGPKSPYPEYLLPPYTDLHGNNNNNSTNKQCRDTATSFHPDGDFVVPSGDDAAFTQMPIKVAPSLSRSVSFSSLDARVVPDSTSSEISTPLLQLGGGNGGGGDPAPPTVTGYEPMDPKAREARVLRYREKRKNRKFERTIRYASRKIYADTRPRIKGRFAKKDNNPADVLQPFGQDEPVFGVVPAS